MSRSNSRRRISGAAALVLLAAAGAARGQGVHAGDHGDGGHGSGGNPPPLAIETPALSKAGRLAWIAPYDSDTLDGPPVAAGAYQVYLSPAPITAANFGGATLVPVPFAPAMADSAEEFWLPGLTAGQAVYVAIRSNDNLDATLWSALAATDMPVVIEVPQALQALHPYGATETSIAFGWDVPAETDRDNASNGIRLRLSKDPDFATFQEFPAAAGTWLPIDTLGHVFEGLDPATTCYCSASVRNPSGLVREFPATGVPGQTLAHYVPPPPPPPDGTSGSSCPASAATAGAGIAVLVIGLVIALRPCR